VKAEKAPPAASSPAASSPPAANPAEVVRLRDLVESVVLATGAKKPEAKKAVEATLAAIGSALAAKSTLVVPPLGKLRLVKANAGVMTLKLRVSDAARAKGLALADDEEDD